MCWWFFILYFPCGVEIVHILLRKMKDTECMIWFAKIQVRFATYLHTIAILSSREVHALSLLHFSREVHALSLLHAMIRQWQRRHMVMKTRHMISKFSRVKQEKVLTYTGVEWHSFSRGHMPRQSKREKSAFYRVS